MAHPKITNKRMNHGHVGIFHTEMALNFDYFQTKVALGLSDRFKISFQHIFDTAKAHLMKLKNAPNLGADPFRANRINMSGWMGPFGAWEFVGIRCFHRIMQIMPKEHLISR